MTTEQLLGATAVFDAVVVAVIWLVVYARQKRYAGPPSQVVMYFKQNILWTFGFLAFVGAALLAFTGVARSVADILGAICLWVALYYIILLTTIGYSGKWKAVAMVAFIIMATLGTMYKIATMFGITVDFGTVINYVLGNMTAILMYAVWLPCALVFFASGVRAAETAVRMRFILFATGLVLITFSWAWRLLIVDPSLLVVTITSLLGFFSLLSGVVYGSRPSPVRA